MYQFYRRAYVGSRSLCWANMPTRTWLRLITPDSIHHVAFNVMERCVKNKNVGRFVNGESENPEITCICDRDSLNLDLRGSVTALQVFPTPEF